MTFSPEVPTAVVTGANSGVGFHATRLLAEEGWQVVMACRSRERGSEALERIRDEVPDAALELSLCDLARLDDVVELSEDLRRRPRLDVLVNNAGLYSDELFCTEDGFERTMAVNHLAHFLLTLRLEDRLREPGHRVVNVASGAHRHGKLRRAPLEEILRGSTDDYSGVRAYGDSKLANVLFTRELERRWGPDGTVALAVHPGVLSSNIWSSTKGLLSFLTRLIRPFMNDPEQGGRVTARAATDPDLEDRGGAYLKKFEIVEPSDAARDPELAAELWETSARLLRDRL